MKNRTLIGTALAVFLALLLLPAWYAAARPGTSQAPELELPRDSAVCIEDVETMRSHHVALLAEWRNLVVRDGQRTDTSSAGVERPMSLTGTCLGCHGKAETFCTRCHDYSGVKLPCWDCHAQERSHE